MICDGFKTGICGMWEVKSLCALAQRTHGHHVMWLFHSILDWKKMHFFLQSFELCWLTNCRRLHLIWAKLYSYGLTVNVNCQRQRNIQRQISNISPYWKSVQFLKKLNFKRNSPVSHHLVPILLCCICVRETHPYLNEALSVTYLCDLISFSRIGRKT